MLKRIINKLIYWKQLQPIQSLIKEGYIKCGEGCDLASMTVFIFTDKIPGKTYIQIGNNCCVRGILIIYRDTARITMGNNVYIGPGTYVECTESITIGNRVLISMHSHLIDTNSHSLHSHERREDAIEWQKGLSFKDWSKVQCAPIDIADDSWIGLRSIVMKGVKLSQSTIVAAGSVVTKSTNSFEIVAGNPAVVVKTTD